MNVKPESTRVTRRRFVSWSASAVGGAVSLFVFLAASLRMPLPSLMPGRSKRFKIGAQEDYPPGTAHYFESQQTYVFADQDGIFAMSATCTHLGCIVKRERDRFDCPCHGSRYDLNGKVLRGPAPKDLEWFDVQRLASGKLVVNRAQVVPPGTKLLV